MLCFFFYLFYSIFILPLSFFTLLMYMPSLPLPPSFFLSPSSHLSHILCLSLLSFSYSLSIFCSYYLSISFSCFRVLYLFFIYITWLRLLGSFLPSFLPFPAALITYIHLTVLISHVVTSLYHKFSLFFFTYIFVFLSASFSFLSFDTGFTHVEHYILLRSLLLFETFFSSHFLFFVKSFSFLLLFTFSTHVKYSS